MNSGQLSKANINKKAKRNRLKPDARYRQLMDLAVVIAAQKGLGHTRHADIAILAEVAVSTVFFYFPTVEILQNAVLGEVEKVFKSVSIDKTIHKKSFDDSKKLLNMYCEVLEQTYREKHNYVVIYLEWGTAINNPIWVRYLTFRKKRIKLIKKALEKLEKNDLLHDNVDLNTAVIMFSSIQRMFFCMKCFDNSDNAIREIQNYIWNHIFK